MSKVTERIKKKEREKGSFLETSAFLVILGVLTLFLREELDGLQPSSSSNITKLNREKSLEEREIEEMKLIFKNHLQSCHSFLGVKTPLLLVDLRICSLHHLVPPLS